MHALYIYIICIMYPLYLTFLKGINSFIIYKIFHKDIHIFYRQVNIFRSLKLFLHVIKMQKQTIYNYLVNSFLNLCLCRTQLIKYKRLKGWICETAPLTWTGLMIFVFLILSYIFVLKPSLTHTHYGNCSTDNV